jgi:uncharacterized membrane protein
MKDFPDAGLDAALTGICAAIPLIVVALVAFVGFTAWAYWRNGQRLWSAFYLLITTLAVVMLMLIWWLGRQGPA